MDMYLCVYVLTGMIDGNEENRLTEFLGGKVRHEFSYDYYFYFIFFNFF